tara:strand:+ start:4356 stop:4511 length:156 start_codon:yes stop_codon:yes gene_type:complete
MIAIKVGELCPHRDKIYKPSDDDKEEQYICSDCGVELPIPKPEARNIYYES